MGRPCPVQRDQPPRIDRPAKHVLWHELALVPGDNLLQLSRYPVVVSPFANVSEPFMVRIQCATAMLEPSLDEHISAVVVERGLDELRHIEARGMEYRVIALSFGHVGSRKTGCGGQEQSSAIHPFVSKANKQVPETFTNTPALTRITLHC